MNEIFEALYELTESAQTIRTLSILNILEETDVVLSNIRIEQVEALAGAETVQDLHRAYLSGENPHVGWSWESGTERVPSNMLALVEEFGRLLFASEFPSNALRAILGRFQGDALCADAVATGLSAARFASKQSGPLAQEMREYALDMITTLAPVSVRAA